MGKVASSERRDASKTKRPLTTRQKLSLAMQDPDRWACRIIYQDRDGKRTKRLISPIRWIAKKQNLLALCINREEPRHFTITGIQSVELVDASDVLMGGSTVAEAEPI
ncbi:WYL domain-containing protein [Planctomycetes bacterium TBK1r]|uniref:WYL domain-containing protein n=1 Tax=Stieleria magnilauensis TaxID=2527963 RepID=A0ABX5XTN8_9BACT|nr:hypothetical protein TBK1r_39140 [Planctomycetes bacterium TBK1r]